MSFSIRVKEELSGHFGRSAHCLRAEAAAILSYGSSVKTLDGEIISISLKGENDFLKKKCFKLFDMAFNIVGTSEITSKENILQVLKIIKKTKVLSSLGTVDSRLIKNECCRRAMLRGVFLCIGNVSDPSGKSYHMEFVCDDEDRALGLKAVMTAVGIEPSITIRRRDYIVYLKDSDAIADMLNLMEAHVSLMELENARAMKYTRGYVNRKVNFETANIAKAVRAAERQSECIRRIIESGGESKISEPLRQLAFLRLEYPEASLEELGGLLEPPIGKSAVNHRMRKLCEIAEKLD